MPSLTIGWEYLTGYAVATDPSSRDRVEWPPHPGRVFMALAAAWFETEPLVDDGDARKAWEAEGDSLRWVETLGDPELHLPRVEPQFERSNVTVYVPVNDKTGPSTATLQSAPALTRSKQARSFPRVWVGHGPCSMQWPHAGGAELDKHVAALDRLCRKVTRVGHSSSLVRMWAGEIDLRADGSGDTWIADDTQGEHHCRVVTKGMLDELPSQTNIPRIVQFAEMDTRIRSSTGQMQKQAKAEFEEQLGEKWKSSASPPPLLRPKLGISKGYRRTGTGETEGAKQHSLFDTDVLVLTHVAGPRLPVVSTLVVTRALRNTIMSESGVQPVPAWVSGHEPNGEPLRSDGDGHLAIIPLPFVGREHADGHLLGVGLVFPRSVERRERGRVLGKLLLDVSGQPHKVELMLGRLGMWAIVKRDWTETRQALAPETWTGQPRTEDGRGGADRWASVTPVVLDKFPKSDRLEDRPAWTQEVVEIVSAACVRIGLPAPVDIDIDTTSWHLGSPRATCKRRPLRGITDGSKDAGAAFGDGFPPFPARGTNAPRPQVHVWLRFAEPVVGPILLGAGRYLGYGLCKPLKDDRR
jgi:CRISPR-associated protein Csb2